jgi:EAL domain-containing protein (putative c-di-GMP-specific phosphodiesterase class I)
LSYPASGGSELCSQTICQGGSFALESVAAFVWNGWQACSGISGRLGVEYAQHNRIRQKKLEAELESAFINSSFEIYYQPKVNLVSCQLYGAEALIRWTHPEYGTISPDMLVHVIEKSHLLEEITLWILNTALHQSGLMRARFPDFRIAVNISPGLLASPDLVELVQRALRIWNTLPDQLILEVTETSMMVNQKLSQRNLRSSAESVGELWLG